MNVYWNFSGVKNRETFLIERLQEELKELTYDKILLRHEDISTDEDLENGMFVEKLFIETSNFRKYYIDLCRFSYRLSENYPMDFVDLFTSEDHDELEYTLNYYKEFEAALLNIIKSKKMTTVLENLFSKLS